MIVSTALGTSSNPREIPSIQLSRKRREFTVFETRRHDFGGELSFLQNDESAAVGEPRDDVGVFGSGQYLVQLYQ